MKSIENDLKQISMAVMIEFVGIAKALAAKNGYELDANQELFSLGVANIFGSLFSAYHTTGFFSRSSVNHESGANFWNVIFCMPYMKAFAVSIKISVCSSCHCDL